MRLFGSPFSPFGRKVRACACARGIEGQITVHAADLGKGTGLWEVNPIGKIPALVTDDGVAMYDSRVICEYLDTLGDAPAMFPEHGRARWRALIQQALADGVMDAAVLRRSDMARTAEAAAHDRQRAKVERGLAALEADVPHHIVDIGVISVACALGYLDARFEAEPWRPAHPKLAAWFAEVAAMAWMTRTAPNA